MELKTITYDESGYKLDIPILDQTCFISWDSIETIIYGPEIIYHDHSEFIIYLNKPPVVTLKENPWWLNKYTFWMRSKNNKKLRMSDEWNKGFTTFIENIKRYLENVQEIDLYRDARKGTLVKRTEVKENNKTIVKEHWKPERKLGLKWEMVYDKYNRTVEDIYNRDNGI
jgi:hypothetical protein